MFRERRFHLLENMFDFPLVLKGVYITGHICLFFFQSEPNRAVLHPGAWTKKGAAFRTHVFRPPAGPGLRCAGQLQAGGRSRECPGLRGVLGPKYLTPGPEAPLYVWPVHEYVPGQTCHEIYCSQRNDIGHTQSLTRSLGSRGFSEIQRAGRNTTRLTDQLSDN